MIEAYREFARSFRTYWHLYGGARALFSSPYFHLSLLITAICSPIWYGSDGAKIWSDAAINILPNLMGFSIAGMAILLALSNPTAMRAITEDGEPRSYFTETIANFFHFILVQTVALILGFVGKHYSFVALSALGVLFLTYAILVGLAMAMQLLQTARIVNASSSLDNLPARQFRRPHLTTPKKVNTNHVRR